MPAGASTPLDADGPRQGILTVVSGMWDEWDGLISSDSPDPLQVIAMAARYHRYLSAIEERAVEAARAGGATWQDIAEAAGTTRQSAWEKWKAVRRLTEADQDRFAPDVLSAQQQALAELAESLHGRGVHRHT